MTGVAVSEPMVAWDDEEIVIVRLHVDNAVQVVVIAARGGLL